MILIKYALPAILLGEQLMIAEVAGLALIIVGAEITLTGESAKRAGGARPLPTSSGRTRLSTRSSPLSVDYSRDEKYAATDGWEGVDLAAKGDRACTR